MGRLMALLANHWPTHGKLYERFASWEGDDGSSGASLPLRLAGGLHAIVLLGKDDALAAAYPPNNSNDVFLKRAVLGAIQRHEIFLCEWLDNAPQTNEVRRSAVLIAVAHWLDVRFHLPIKLSELGASAGLNLLFDQFSMQIGEKLFGSKAAVVVIAPEWMGALPPVSTPQIIERRGVDLNPLNPSRSKDALRLISYIWPDQADRIARTRAAMTLPGSPVDAGDAIDWLEKRLAVPPSNSTHLIYHTIAWQYFPRDRQILGQKLIEAAGSLATNSAPLAWLSMEADDEKNGAAITIRLWPGDIKISLGRAGFHGQWVEWDPRQI
jgi:hypothetical protein